MNVLVRDDNAPVAIHPPGFKVSDHRKAIPLKVKLAVVIRWEGKCYRCGEKLGSIDDTQFDHEPALAHRPWDEVAGDFVPPQNDPLWVANAHKDCHKVKTCGRRGTMKAPSAGSDVGVAGKIRRVSEDQQAFRAKLLAKTTGEEPPAPKRPKQKWPSRPFPKRPKPRARARA